jgi:hypothetical protein
MGDFSDILKAEERTCQKEINLATLRTRSQMATTQVKG